MENGEYSKLDGCGLSNFVRRREVSAGEVMETAIRIAETANRTLNFLKYPKFEESLSIARSLNVDRNSDTPFLGVPTLLKDSGIPSRRFSSSVGSKLLAGTQHIKNSSFVDRLEKSGLIPFARSTVPEMCMGPNTEAVANEGITHNPWGAELSAGGSSGGAAVAVAAGVVPLAHGSDGAGSIRIPAANCGLLGLKVSRGRFPTGPDDGESWGDLICDGFLTKTVRDMAVAVDAIQGIDDGAPFAAPVAPSSYSATLDVPFERPLRIAVWDETLDGADEIDADTLSAIRYTSKLLSGLGHLVERSSVVQIDYPAFIDAHTRVLSLAISSVVDSAIAKRKRKLEHDDLQYAIFDGYQYGKAQSARDYIRGLAMFRTLGRKLGEYMKNYDAVLLPTVPVASMKHGRFPRDASFLEFREASCRYNAFTALANASGQPAISVPVFRTAAGMPVGVQFLAGYGREDILLRIARQLEDVAPWSESYPIVQIG